MALRNRSCNVQVMRLYISAQRDVAVGPRTVGREEPKFGELYGAFQQGLLLGSDAGFGPSRTTRSRKVAAEIRQNHEGSIDAALAALFQTVLFQHLRKFATLTPIWQCCPHWNLARFAEWIGPEQCPNLCANIML